MHNLLRNSIKLTNKKSYRFCIAHTENLKEIDGYHNMNSCSYFVSIIIIGIIINFVKREDYIQV